MSSRGHKKRRKGKKPASTSESERVLLDEKGNALAVAAAPVTQTTLTTLPQLDNHLGTLPESSMAVEPAQGPSKAAAKPAPTGGTAVDDSNLNTGSEPEWVPFPEQKPLHVHVNTHSVARGTGYGFTEQSLPADDYEAKDEKVPDEKDPDEKDDRDSKAEAALASLMSSLNIRSSNSATRTAPTSTSSISTMSTSTTQPKSRLGVPVATKSSIPAATDGGNNRLRVVDLFPRKPCKINEMLAGDQFAVVFAFLDGHTVGKLAIICKKWSEYTADPMAWRFVCLSIWKDERLQRFAKDWRKLYIMTPHVRFDGFYILETKYWRPGGYTDLGTRPTTMMCVSYFRYLKFLPGRKIMYALMNSLPEMPMTRPLPANEKRLCSGTFRLASPGIKVRVDLPHMSASFDLSFWSSKNVECYDKLTQKTFDAPRHDCLIVENFEGQGPFDAQPIQFPKPQNYFYFFSEVPS